MARVSFGSRRRSTNGGTATPVAGVYQVASKSVMPFFTCFYFFILEKDGACISRLFCFCGTGGVMMRELVRDCGEA